MMNRKIKGFFAYMLLVICFGCDKRRDENTDASTNIVAGKDSTINNGITVNYYCRCGQYITAHGTFKNGDKIQCGNCGREVTYTGITVKAITKEYIHTEGANVSVGYQTILDTVHNIKPDPDTATMILNNGDTVKLIRMF